MRLAQPRLGAKLAAHWCQRVDDQFGIHGSGVDAIALVGAIYVFVPFRGE